MKDVFATVKGDDSGRIDDLIDFLKTQKEKGATHYNMRWSGDPMWAFKWFEVYRIKSEEEIKLEKIKELQKKINDLNK